MRARWIVAAAGGLMVFGTALAADYDRGKALYEFACDACHRSSVHQRKKRKATSFELIRDNVVRWNRALGTQWTDDEIDSVARYLNERYYHLPCPESICQSDSVMSR